MMASILPSAQQQQIRKLGSSGSRAQQKVGRITVVHAGVLCALSAVIAFYFGMVLGSSAATSSSSTSSMNANAEGSNKCFTASQVREKIQEALKKHSSSSPEKEVAISRDTDRRFPEGMERLVVGMAQIERDEFNKKFDLGLPLDPSDTKNSQVLILYSSEKTLPSNPFRSNEAKSQTAIPSMAADEATENCDALHVILQDHSGTRRQCTAILGQYEAFHIQKFMRLPDKGKLDPSQPLRIVNRGAQTSGRLSVAPPGLETTQNGWKALQKYLNLMDDALKTLDPLAKKAAVDNSIVVQVCNFGQSELLLNFLCSAKRRGLDTSSILVFATDQETYDLVNQMGNANVVFLKDIFDEMPSKAAKAYGDKSFMQMMMAKVYCVHLIAMLGYDVLFQDVDVVWYRNPIHYFHDENALDASFDVYFQDDGNHALYYAPYSANTGFYYVRSNERTLHFLNSFLMAGDLVLQSRSHQIPLVALLQEHASMYGLKIKIFSRDGDTFPGGHAFHRRKTFMKDILEGTAHPEIFHMSWTKSKDNKKKFFEQMGEWFLQDKCTSKSMHEIYPSRPDDKTDMVSDCCSLEPRVSCHYRDKPSKIPCKDSPPIDTGAKSFW